MTAPRREALSALLLGLLSLGACAVKAPVYGLRPEYPEVLRHGKEVVFSLIDSTRPMLRWEAFPPREGFKWVVYDLKVYREDNGAPGRLIEEKNGLAEPHYQFQKELVPCAKYYWSARARFRIEGREQATEWGVVQVPGRERWVPVTPDPGYYRFQTPCR